MTPRGERLTTQTQDVSKFLDRLHSELRELEVNAWPQKNANKILARIEAALQHEGQQEQRQKSANLRRKIEIADQGL